MSGSDDDFLNQIRDTKERESADSRMRDERDVRRARAAEELFPRYFAQLKPDLKALVRKYWVNLSDAEFERQVTVTEFGNHHLKVSKSQYPSCTMQVTLARQCLQCEYVGRPSGEHEYSQDAAAFVLLLDENDDNTVYAVDDRGHHVVDLARQIVAPFLRMV